MGGGGVLARLDRAAAKRGEKQASEPRCECSREREGVNPVTHVNKGDTRAARTSRARH